jgi:hypothetical protein
MTWHADQIEGRPEGDAKAKLLVSRAEIVSQIERLSIQPLRSKTQSAAAGRQEDLFALAKKIKAIDKKLGRTV